MKRDRRSETTVVRTCTDTPEAIDESCITLERAIDFATDADGYWPRRVEAAFLQAGFAIRQIQREEFHPSVWMIWLTRGPSALPKDNKAASAQIRKALSKGGLKIRAGEFTVLEQRGEKLRCAFIYGSAGPPADI
jgi:hypothetical protein